MNLTTNITVNCQTHCIVETHLNNSLLVVSVHRENLEHTAGCEEKLLVGITSHDAHQLGRSSGCQNDQLAFFVAVSQHMKAICKKQAHICSASDNYVFSSESFKLKLEVLYLN